MHQIMRSFTAVSTRALSALLLILVFTFLCHDTKQNVLSLWKSTAIVKYRKNNFQKVICLLETTAEITSTEHTF